MGQVASERFVHSLKHSSQNMWRQQLGVATLEFRPSVEILQMSHLGGCSSVRWDCWFCDTVLWIVFILGILLFVCDFRVGFKDILLLNELISHSNMSL